MLIILFQRKLPILFNEISTTLIQRPEKDCTEEENYRPSHLWVSMQKNFEKHMHKQNPMAH